MKAAAMASADIHLTGSGYVGANGLETCSGGLNFAAMVEQAVHVRTETSSTTQAKRLCMCAYMRSRDACVQIQGCVYTLCIILHPCS